MYPKEIAALAIGCPIAEIDDAATDGDGNLHIRHHGTYKFVAAERVKKLRQSAASPEATVTTSSSPKTAVRSRKATKPDQP